MDRFLSRQLLTRLSRAVIVVCLVTTPFSANCCVPAGCGSAAPPNSSSPCHEGMTSDNHAKFAFRTSRTICVDPGLVQSTVSSDESFRNAKNLLKGHARHHKLNAQNSLFSNPKFVDTSQSSPEDFTESAQRSTTLPLKL